MSIKSDRWIKQQCQVPSRLYSDFTGTRYTLSEMSPAEWDEYKRNFGADIANGKITIIDNPTAEQAMEFGWRPMIEPFAPEQVRQRLVKDIGMEDGERREEKLISYGVSSYGYDVRCANEFKVFTNLHSTIVDPKNFDEKNYVDVVGDKCIIPPNSFALARTVEYFRIPRDVLTICLGKSTYARCGIIVNVTPLEPEWEGHVTLEFSNTTNLPAVIYANEGVAQMLFLQSDEECDVSYKDRGGKYQGQTGVTLPKA